MKDSILRGIHAGSAGDADSLFSQESVVAIGWHEMGDLSAIHNDREAFKMAVAKAYPEATGRDSQLCRSAS